MKSNLLPVLLFLFIACQKNQPLPGQLKASKTSILLSALRDSRDSFFISSTTAWSVRIEPSSAAWVRLSMDSGSGDAGIIVSAALENTGSTPRTATLVLSAYNPGIPPVEITVTQNSGEIFFAWQRTAGGSGNEFLYSMVPAGDGMLAAGYTFSHLTGDVGAGQGNKDAWVARFSAEGNKVWAKSFGGLLADQVNSVIATSDGGFLLIGQSASHNGDLTENRGGTDLWLLQIDAAGNKRWQKTYGGSLDDIGYGAVQTSDGGFLVTGQTVSNDLDVSGNHGNSDSWLLKTDAAGNLLWQRCYGGSSNDIAYSILQDPRGNIVLCGTTSSHNGDVTGFRGVTDIWILKLNSEGGLTWSKTLGGSGFDAAWWNALAGTADEGILIAGNTTSNNYGTGNGFGGLDIWVVKLNASGEILWNSRFGGSGEDQAFGITISENGGSFLTGSTSSTDGDIDSNHGRRDTWLVKLDATGNKIWQKTYGGTGDEYGISVIRNGSNSLYIGSSTNSVNDGDISGSQGGFDYWLLKLNCR